MEMYMTKVYYVASPYTGKRKTNYKNTLKWVDQLINKGYTVLSPIIHCHNLPSAKKLPPAFWYEYDMHLLNKCDGIIMCPGYIHSYGCMLELQEAFRLDLEILLLRDCLENES